MDKELKKMEFQVKKQSEQISRIIEVITDMNKRITYQQDKTEELNVQIQILMGEVGARQGKLF
jgi:septal ring factor EnvC (AmiA/AmiB activator)